MKKALKKTSAWLPPVMSLIAFALVIIYVYVFGIAQDIQSDEGLPARVFQLLIAGQLPIIAYFIIHQKRKTSKETIQVVLLQLAAAIIPVLLVGYLEM